MVEIMLLEHLRQDLCWKSPAGKGSRGLFSCMTARETVIMIRKHHSPSGPRSRHAWRNHLKEKP